MMSTLLRNLQERYMLTTAGVGIIGFFMANVVWKQVRPENPMETKKKYYYNQSVLLLHFRHQTQTYLPLILSSVITVSATYLYSKYYSLNNYIINPPNMLWPKQMGIILFANYLMMKGLNSKVLNKIKWNQRNDNDLYEYYIESAVRNDIIGRLSKQILEVRNILNEYCINIDCEIGPQIREEIMSYIGIPMYNHKQYKSSMDLFEYVSNDLKKQFIYDDKLYQVNYPLMSSWKTKTIIHFFVFAEVVQLCCKWMNM
eukprot:104407_1